MTDEKLEILTPNGLRLLSLDAAPTPADLRDITHFLAPDPVQNHALTEAAADFPITSVEAFNDACQAWLIGQTA